MCLPHAAVLSLRPVQTAPPSRHLGLTQLRRREARALERGQARRRVEVRRRNRHGAHLRRGCPTLTMRVFTQCLSEFQKDELPVRALVTLVICYRSGNLRQSTLHPRPRIARRSLRSGPRGAARAAPKRRRAPPRCAGGRPANIRLQCTNIRARDSLATPPTIAFKTWLQHVATRLLQESPYRVENNTNVRGCYA